MNDFQDAFLNAAYRRGFEPPEEVVITAAIGMDPTLQPEDYGVLIRLLLRDPTQPGTMADLVKEMQASGFKMGETRFAGIFRRLKQAGHVSHRSEFDPETKRPRWVVEFFRNPANNRRYVEQGARAASQVRTETVDSTDSQPAQSFETVDSTVSAGQSRNRGFHGSAPNPWNPRFPSEPVPAGQSRNRENHGFPVHPPHPPEGEVTTSSTATQGPAARGEGEVQSFAREEIAAASRLLQMLPNGWAARRDQAQKLAPKLLETIADQGWPRIQAFTEEDRARLVADLTEDDDKVKSKRAVLPTRVEGVRLYEIVCAAAKPAPRRAAPDRFTADDVERVPARSAEFMAGIVAQIRKPQI